MAAPSDKTPPSPVKEAAEAADEFKKPEANPMLAEEAKLKAKYPNVGRPMAGHSAFLQKRLQKGQKYFDSGDYQMAKQRPGPSGKLRGGLQIRPTPSTGDTIPTPESLPARKPSLVQNSQTPLSS